MIAARLARPWHPRALLLRCLGSAAGSGPRKLIFSEFGDPAKVMRLVDEDAAVLDAELAGDEVLLRVLASPVNPSDMNYVEGKYAIRPASWPAISGNEGVMEVVRAGPQAAGFRPGDRVLPASAGQGLWRTHLRLAADQLLRVDARLPVAAAATLTVNPCTAHRLLADFADLRPGDWVLQNAATSGVGLFVAQLCRLRGLRSCNVIRARPTDDETDAVRQALLEFGADLVLTEAELRNRAAVQEVKAAGGARLTLNCVGGKQALSLIGLMAHGSPLITYGAMAMAPMTVPAGPLIFKDLTLRGFWMSAWSLRPENAPARQVMLDALTEQMVSGQLRLPPYAEVPLEEYERAIAASQLGGRGPSASLPTKQILTMT